MPASPCTHPAPRPFDRPRHDGLCFALSVDHSSLVVPRPGEPRPRGSRFGRTIHARGSHLPLDLRDDGPQIRSCTTTGLVLPRIRPATSYLLRMGRAGRGRSGGKWEKVLSLARITKSVLITSARSAQGEVNKRRDARRRRRDERHNERDVFISRWRGTRCQIPGRDARPDPRKKKPTTDTTQDAKKTSRSKGRSSLGGNRLSAAPPDPSLHSGVFRGVARCFASSRPRQTIDRPGGTT